MSEDCTHRDLAYTGDRDSTGNTVYEVYRCESCGTRVHKVFEHTHNLVETEDGDVREVDV